MNCCSSFGQKISGGPVSVKERDTIWSIGLSIKEFFCARQWYHFQFVSPQCKVGVACGQDTSMYVKGTLRAVKASNAIPFSLSLKERVISTRCWISVSSLVRRDLHDSKWDYNAQNCHQGSHLQLWLQAGYVWVVRISVKYYRTVPEMIFYILSLYNKSISSWKFMKIFLKPFLHSFPCNQILSTEIYALSAAFLSQWLSLHMDSWHKMLWMIRKYKLDLVSAT